MCGMEQPKQEKKAMNSQFIFKKSAGVQVHSVRAIIKHLHICWHFHNYICNSHILDLAALNLKMHIFTFAYLPSFVSVALAFSM